jgi:hypothetical protein
MLIVDSAYSTETLLSTGVVGTCNPRFGISTRTTKEDA